MTVDENGRSCASDFILKIQGMCGPDFLVSMRSWSPRLVETAAQLKWGRFAVLNVWRISL